MAFKKTTYNTINGESRLNTVEPIRSKQDIERIIQFFDKQGWHKYSVIFQLGIYSGLRISDVLGFRVKDVKGKQKLALREQKTGKTKFFPLQPRIYNLLNEWCEGKPDEAWMFEGHQNKKLDRSQVYRRINEACQALKIDANVGTHTLRKTFGYHCFRQFNNITILQTIFNHTSPDVTKRYIGITQDEIDKIYLNINLSTEDPLEEAICKGRSQKRIQALMLYFKTYLKTGGEEHRDFVLTCIDILKHSGIRKKKMA